MIWSALRRYRWVFALLLLAVILFVPAVDLTVSGWFYDPATNSFPARHQALPEWVRLDMPRLLFAGLGCVVAAWVAGFWVGERIFGISHRLVGYLLTSLALGPGLVVNTILKDNWGRPRPSTLQQFGGDKTYVPPFWISDQCDRNCSFPSGHGSLGFWMVTLAFLAPPAWRLPAFAAALGWGACVGWVRIAQGGHFLSDVIIAAIITIGCSWGLYRLFFAPSQKNNHFLGL